MEMRTDNGLNAIDDFFDLDEITEPLLQKRKQEDGEALLVWRIDSLICTYYGKPVKGIVQEVAQKIEYLFLSEEHTLSDAEHSYITDLILAQPEIYISVVFHEYAHQKRAKKEIIMRERQFDNPKLDNEAFGMRMAAFKQKQEAHNQMNALLEAYGQSLGY